MFKNLRTVWVLGLVAVVAVVALGALMIARPVAAAAQAAVSANGGPGSCGQAGLDAAAKALNMTSADLKTQLWGGATLSDLATKAGVKLADVQAAVTAACNTQTKAAIEAAVTAGTLTRDKADWLLQGLDKGYWGPNSGGPDFGIGGFGPRGFGGFGGFGPGHGRRGPGNFGGPNNKPSATGTPTG